MVNFVAVKSSSFTEALKTSNGLTAVVALVLVLLLGTQPAKIGPAPFLIVSDSFSDSVVSSGSELFHHCLKSFQLRSIEKPELFQFRAAYKHNLKSPIHGEKAFVGLQLLSRFPHNTVLSFWGKSKCKRVQTTEPQLLRFWVPFEYRKCRKSQFGSHQSQMQMHSENKLGCQSGGELFTPTFRLDYSAIALLVALWTEGFKARKSRAAL